ncbi:MAG TPA: hypothetical protein PLB02_15935, partial [Thermoanaerobaculia bacterium]|nr:hypothetical protein [Thermoanaerobaculia bacterium]HQR68879.1 hypothetical protein [Thermoanaerobaculia bacterium]
MRRLLPASALAIALCVTAPRAAGEAHDLMPAPARIVRRDGRLVLPATVLLAPAGAADPRIDAALR